jgi:hypothetical protein
VTIEEQFDVASRFLWSIQTSRRWIENPWRPGLMSGVPMYEDERRWIVGLRGQYRPFWRRGGPQRIPKVLLRAR